MGLRYSNLCLTSAPQDSDAHSGLRSADLAAVAGVLLHTLGSLSLSAAAKSSHLTTPSEDAFGQLVPPPLEALGGHFPTLTHTHTHTHMQGGREPMADWCRLPKPPWPQDGTDSATLFLPQISPWDLAERGEASP